MKSCMLATALTLSLLAGSVFAQGKSKEAPVPQERAKSSAPAKAFKDVDAETFDTLRKSGNTNQVVVLDVRTQEEYEQGHIHGAKLLDVMADDFEEQVAKLDKNKTYLVHCASGGRSARACKKMGTLDFQKLYNLKGGMQAWEKAGKPVEK